MNHSVNACLKDSISCLSAPPSCHACSNGGTHAPIHASTPLVESSKYLMQSPSNLRFTKAAAPCQANHSSFSNSPCLPQKACLGDRQRSFDMCMASSTLTCSASRWDLVHQGIATITTDTLLSPIKLLSVQSSPLGTLHYNPSLWASCLPYSVSPSSS
jgi:hypothetical protein